MIDFTHVDDLSDEAWNDYSTFLERLNALQSLENELAKEQNRPPCAVHSKELEDHVGGVAPESEAGKIFINRNDIQWSTSSRDSIEAVAHEGKHAHQRDCIANRESHPEVNQEEINKWEHNLKDENYIPYNQNRKGYWEQPVEADAHQFAASVVDDYNKYQAAKKSLDDLPPSASQSGGDEKSPVTEHAAESRTEPSAAISAEHQAQIDRAQSMLPPPAISAAEPKTSVTQHTPEEQSAPIPKITPEHQAQIDKARSMLPPPPPPAASDENAQKTSLSQ